MQTQQQVRGVDFSGHWTQGLFSCWTKFDIDNGTGLPCLHFNKLELILGLLTETVHVLEHLQEQSNKLLCLSFLLYLCDWQLNSGNTHTHTKSYTADMHFVSKHSQQRLQLNPEETLHNPSATAFSPVSHDQLRWTAALQLPHTNKLHG